MANQLSIFEFVSYKNIVDTISEFVRDLSLMEANPIKYHPNPNTIRWAATKIIERVKDLLNSENKVSYEEVIQPELAKLNKYKETVPDIENRIKELEVLLSKAYPERFMNREKLFKQATNIDRRFGSDFDQVIPQDPNLPLSQPTPEELVRARAVGLRRLGI